MSFKSNIGGCPVIDDSNADEFIAPVVDGEVAMRGMMPRDFDREPWGTLGFAGPFALPRIDRSEWDERIRDREANRSRVADMCDQAGLQVKNQSRTNFCWINAPVHTVEVARVAAGQEYVELSPASCGAKIKNFRNVGGWGTEGVRWLAEHGAVPASLWPNNAIDRRYDTPEANAERSKYRVVEWWELKPRDFDETATCLLLGIPVCVGLNWWGHEVTLIDLVKLDGRGRYGALFNNSWGTSWGDNGRGVLTEAKARPDDAIAPRVVVGD